MIDITGVDLRKFIKEVYALSKPAGLGHIHFVEGELDDETVDLIVRNHAENATTAISMDRIKGRACKMTVRRQDGKLFINDTWSDHSRFDFEELLQRCNIDGTIIEELKAAPVDTVVDEPEEEEKILDELITEDEPTDVDGEDDAVDTDK